MPQVPIDPRKTGLVIFDMLQCYVYPTDPVRARFMAESRIVERCREILDAARETGIRVYYANGAYRADGTDCARTIVDANMELVPWPDGPRRMQPPTAVEGSPEAQIIPELEPRPEDYVIGKHRWSAFVGTPLDLLLSGVGIDTILLCGGSTDMGVLATAYSARDHGYNLIVLRDACQTHREGAQEFSMERLFPRMARVMTVRQAIGLISREP